MKKASKARDAMIGKRHRMHRQRRLRGLGLWWTFACSLVLGAALIVAIVQNSRHVRLHYLGWHLNVSLIVVILATALIAVLLDEVGGLIWRRRRRASLERRNELSQLQTQQRRFDQAAAENPTPPRAETQAPPPGSVEPVT
jgi:uncharacterized integral membrane protein